MKSVDSHNHVFFSLEEDTNTISSLSPGVQKNTVLFQGFCAMKYAVYALCVNAHKYTNCAECESKHQQQKPPEAEINHHQTSTSSEGLETDFYFL